MLVMFVDVFGFVLCSCENGQCWWLLGLVVVDVCEDGDVGLDVLDCVEFLEMFNIGREDENGVEDLNFNFFNLEEIFFVKCFDWVIFLQIIVGGIDLIFDEIELLIGSRIIKGVCCFMVFEGVGFNGNMEFFKFECCFF